MFPVDSQSSLLKTLEDVESLCSRIARTDLDLSDSTRKDLLNIRKMLDNATCYVRNDVLNKSYTDDQD